MRPLLNCITATAFAASCLTFASPGARGEELQWVHRAQQQASPTVAAKPQAAAETPPPKQVRVEQLAAKQPTFQQPKPFKQPTQAKPVPVAANNRAESPATNGQSPRPRVDSTATMNYRNRRASGGPMGLAKMASQVAPAQWARPTQAYEEIPPGEMSMEDSGYVMGDSTYAYPDDSVYAGEATCGFPEPTCGCAGPCMCGDGCYAGEPGCGCGNDVVFGEPGCGVGPVCGDGCACGCGDGMCGCGDACCGDAVCEPTCACGGAGCAQCRNWPHSLFGCEDRGCIPILWIPPVKELTFFGGVHGFKGPLDGTRDGGNFGFHEGFNIGGKMAWLPWPGLGYQFGYMATQNQLSGDFNTETDDSHSQHFITTGLFHRRCMGLQWGVVWDMLRDERQGANDYGQVRGEVSFRNPANRELGFAFAANSNSNLVGTTTYQAADQYLFFYRINGRQGGSCRAFAGFTGQSNGLIGSDFHMPLTNRWSLEGNWVYLIPDSGNNGSAAREEAWNLSMQLVWHYGYRAKSWHQRPYRPMFNVADNGSLIVVD